MYNGRHSSLKNALRYYEDAGALAILAEANRLNFRQLVPKFKPFRFRDRSYANALNAPSLRNQRPLHVLAKHYVEELLKLTRVCFSILSHI